MAPNGWGGPALGLATWREEVRDAVREHVSEFVRGECVDRLTDANVGVAGELLCTLYRSALVPKLLTHTCRTHLIAKTIVHLLDTRELSLPEKASGIAVACACVAEADKTSALALVASLHAMHVFGKLADFLLDIDAAAQATAVKNRSQQHGPTSIPVTQPVPQHPWCGEARASSGYTASVQPAAREAGAR